MVADGFLCSNTNHDLPLTDYGFEHTTPMAQKLHISPSKNCVLKESWNKKKPSKAIVCLVERILMMLMQRYA